MTRFSFNPYQKYGKALSPQSFRELIIEQQRRIKEITTAIIQAKQYLTEHPDSKPVLFRLKALKKEKVRVHHKLTVARGRLEELLKRIRESKQS